MQGEQVRRWPLSRPLDLPGTLMILRRSPRDPTTRFVGGQFWRASRTPDGPGTIAVEVTAGEVRATAWGPGADWLLAGAPALVGEHDDWSDLDLSSAPVLADLHRRRPGLRLARTSLILESLVPAVLEQRVTGGEAWRAWRGLIARHSEPAPGPAEPALWLPASPEAVRAVPSWDWHRFGVDPGRARTIRGVAMVAAQLERGVVDVASDDPAGIAEVIRRLRVLPGIGEWTAAEVTLRALGNPDAVSVGDFHLKNWVGWVLAGAVRSDDEQMVRLLEPWAGQRARIVRLVELSGRIPPKFGPRFAGTNISRI